MLIVPSRGKPITGSAQDVAVRDDHGDIWRDRGELREKIIARGSLRLQHANSFLESAMCLTGGAWSLDRDRPTGFVWLGHHTVRRRSPLRSRQRRAGVANSGVPQKSTRTFRAHVVAMVMLGDFGCRQTRIAPGYLSRSFDHLFMAARRSARSDNR
jgi:hypothetical protein